MIYFCRKNLTVLLSILPLIRPRYARPPSPEGEGKEVKLLFKKLSFCFKMFLAPAGRGQIGIGFPPWPPVMALKQTALSSKWSLFHIGHFSLRSVVSFSRQKPCFARPGPENASAFALFAKCCIYLNNSPTVCGLRATALRRLFNFFCNNILTFNIIRHIILSAE